MKKICILFLLIAATFVTKAQTRRTALVPAEPVSKSISVSKDAAFVSYEKVISPGRLSLAKVFTQTESGQSIRTNYTLTFGSDVTFNNRKPVKIGLSRQSFDSVFTRGNALFASKYAVMNKFVSDNNIPLGDEKGWIALIQYFNNLP